MNHTIQCRVGKKPTIIAVRRFTSPEAKAGNVGKISTNKRTEPEPNRSQSQGGAIDLDSAKRFQDDMLESDQDSCMKPIN